MQNTENQWKEIVINCKAIFLKKNSDYGTSWRVFRLSSLTDQIFIKLKRIRSIQEKKENKVGDSIQSEFQGIINYCLMALTLFHHPEPSENELIANLEIWYEEQVNLALQTMIQKNHDYGEVWREMRISSMVDLSIVKILRIKQIEDNEGKTEVSEGVDGNYVDILNYSVFALILDSK